jgi:benzoyl-CoA reductase subunit C
MISKFAEAYENRHQLARKWRKEGRKVFGYIYSFIPEELLYAAGIVPVQLTESEERGTTSKGETFLPEYFCDYVQSLIGQGVDGMYSYLDGLLVPDACVPLRALAEIWDLHVKTPFFHYLGYPSEAYEGSRAYLREELSRLRRALGEHCGKEISDAALRQAIEVYNENRSLMKKLYELRQKDNPPLSGSEVFEVVKAGLVIPKEEHNRMLQELLNQVSGEERKIEGKPRLMVSAVIFEECSFTRPNFIRIIEELGGEVVCDDLCIGHRYFWDLVATDTNPLDAIVDRYLGKVPIAYKIPAEVRTEIMLNEALKHRVQGLIIFLPKYCESSYFQAPYIEEKFEEKGIPALELESTAEMPEAPLRTRIQAFLEMLQ